VWRQVPGGMYRTAIQQTAHRRASPEAVEVHVTTHRRDENFVKLQPVCSAKVLGMLCF
jgi:hypothetical protein